jgi:hypothetical protein
MESSQNENVMIIDGENEGLSECNMEDEIFNVNFQTKQSTIEQTNVEKIIPNKRNQMERNL